MPQPSLESDLSQREAPSRDSHTRSIVFENATLGKTKPAEEKQVAAADAFFQVVPRFLGY